MSTDPSITRLACFPDSGHQYVFLPFSTEREGPYWVNDLPGLAEYCRSEKCPWRPYLEQGELRRWVRWRYGTRENSPGIWVAVETNLGSTSRGALYQKRSRTETVPHFEHADFGSHYYCESVKDLPDSESVNILPFVFDANSVPEEYRKRASSLPGRMLGRAATVVAPPPRVAVAPPPLCPPLLPEAPEGALSPETKLSQGAPSPSGPRVIQRLAVWWPRPASETWDVDLIVDFGNSRSVLLLLEEAPPDNPANSTQRFNDIIRPVRFVPRGTAYETLSKNPGEDPTAILDTWVILHETMFSSFDPPAMTKEEAMAENHSETIVQKKGWFGKQEVSQIREQTLRVPQMFAEVAPCVVGADAMEAFDRFDFNKENVVYQSSPKRYAWDTDRTPSYWGMAVNSWNPKFTALQTQELAGYVLSYMYEECVDDEADADWPIDQPPLADEVGHFHALEKPSKPDYARCNTIVWMALAVLEAAYRQLTSQAYRAKRGHFTPRRLKSISVTFPSGWTGRELKLYRRKWQTAINIFAHTHLDRPEEDSERNESEKVVPRLHMEVDEGLASQLPIVYGEIDRMGSGRDWLDLIGKRGSDGTPTGRIMTIDIGGGTTDYVILEYRDRAGGDRTDLLASMLYKDSSPTAGDLLVKGILEKIVLPQLARDAGIAENEDASRAFSKLFSSSKIRGVELEEWKRVFRLALLPLVNELLRRWADGHLQTPVSQSDDIPGFTRGAVDSLNRLGKEIGLKVDIWDPAKAIRFDAPPKFESVLRECFGYLFQSFSKLVPVFGVDLVILTGKPSEIPAVRDLLEECLALPKNRVVAVKDFPIGEWYPFKSFGKISDAKTVTACGAALYRAIKRSMVPRWSGIERRTSGAILRNNCWMSILDERQPEAARVIYLDNGRFERFQEESGWVEIAIGTRIGRSLLPGAARNPDPVYIFRWRRDLYGDDRKEWGLPALKAQLRRVVPEPSTAVDDPDEPEYLQLIAVSGEVVLRRGAPDEERIDVGMEHVELKLCTLDGSEHWLDAAMLDVDLEPEDRRPEQRGRGGRRRR